ncbi:FtsX-like permease family protein [Humibacter sp.]|uniref:FtsX-like permease family protein n=1 Tax=Humibacter sp. TaxID=1940291 RepID=UPI003F7F74A3
MNTGGEASVRSSTAALLLRPLKTFRSGFVALGIIVLLATAGVVAWPAATSALVMADARDRLAQTSAADRDLTGVAPVQFVPGGDGLPSTAGTLMTSLPNALEKARDSMQPALHSVTRPGRFVARSDGVSVPNAPVGLPVQRVATDPPRSALGFSIEADPRLQSDAALVDGTWPTGGLDGHTLDVAVSAATAKSLKWSVGATRTVNLNTGVANTSPTLGRLAGTEQHLALEFRLVGTVAPRNPSADFWALDPIRDSLGQSISGSDSRTTLFHGVVWMDPDAWPQLAMGFGSPYVLAWYGVKPSAIDVASLPDISASATSFLAQPIDTGAGIAAQPLRMTSRLPDIAQSITAREGPVPTLLAIVAIGPLGAAVAVLFVGARLMTSRRARELQLVRVRGGSERRVRGTLALQTALITVPAAVVGGVGAALATAVLFGEVTASAALLIAACAIVPPCAVAITASPESAGKRRPVTALIAELFVLALACASCVLLLQRGATTATDPTSIDPLLVATPLLLVFAVCVLVLRVYPALLRLIGRAARSSRGAVSPVGWAAASRGGAGRRWPLFAMLTGVAVAVFASTTFTTLVTSAQTDAVARVGADVTVSGRLSDAQLKELRGIDGVTVVAPLRLVGYAATSGGENVAAYLVDVHAVAAAQANVADGQRLFPDAGSSGAAPVVVSGLPESTPVTSLTFDNGRSTVPVHAVHRAKDSAAPFLTDETWALVDQARVPSSLREESTAMFAMIGVRPGIDTARVAAAAQAVAGKAAHVDSVQAERMRQGQGPLLAGIQSLMLAGTVLALLMAVGALLLTLAMARGQRIKLLAVLRTLGFDRTQSAALVAWEIVPLAATAIVAGVLTGLGLSWLVVAAVDLRAVTGALAKPELALSPGTVGLVVALFALGTAAALAFAVAAARRSDPARTLRAAEEEL